MDFYGDLMGQENQKYIGFYVDNKTWKALRSAFDKDERSISSGIRFLIKEFLKRKEEEG